MIGKTGAAGQALWMDHARGSFEQISSPPEKHLAWTNDDG
jgi:hypothetical protein